MIIRIVKDNCAIYGEAIPRGRLIAAQDALARRLIEQGIAVRAQTGELGIYASADIRAADHRAQLMGGVETHIDSFGERVRAAVKRELGARRAALASVARSGVTASSFSEKMKELAQKPMRDRETQRAKERSRYREPIQKRSKSK